MNLNNQKIKRDIKDIWLCLTCGEKIIPFDKSSSAGILEGSIFLIGAGVFLIVHWFLGLLVVAFSVIITVIRTSGQKKCCPSCESVNIVPANSPVARKLAKT